MSTVESLTTTHASRRAAGDLSFRTTDVQRDEHVRAQISAGKRCSARGR